MSDGVPLKHVLEPGEYRVEWTMPPQAGGQSRVHGDIELRIDRPPRGNAYGGDLAAWQLGGDSKYAEFPQTHEVGALWGRLLNGLQVVLIDAVIEVWFDGRAFLQARAALVGREAIEAESLGISKLGVQVEGLDAITGVAPIEKVKIPMGVSEGRRHLEWNWEAVGNPDSTQTWLDDGASVELKFLSSYTAPEGFFFRVTFSPVVYVKFAEPVDFNQSLSHWVEPLRRIVALSTGRKELITFLSVTVDHPGGEGSELEFQVYGTGLHQAPFSSRGNDIQNVQRAFLLSPKDMSLLALLRRWQELMDAHHPLLETYASLMFAPDQHPRSRFLLLIQAIEGLHGFETRVQFEQRAKGHSERRSAVLVEAAGHLTPTTMKFVRKYLMKKPPSSLDSAIDAVVRGVPVDVTPALEKTELIMELMRDVRNPKHVAECLRLARNDLAHGTRGYDPRKLNDVVNLLDSVVRAHLLRILGCTEVAQRRAQERRQ